MSSVLDAFEQFQKEMVAQLDGFPNVQGLMFAGSAADLSRVDEYSDQDFYLVVADGHGEEFRRNLSWLPRVEEITLSPRETDHGLKVFYQDGTMLEFAVFEVGELPNHLAPKDNRVVYDTGGIAPVIDEISKKSKPRDFRPSDEYQLFLTILHIGAGRIKRGEIIAGAQHIKSYAINHLLGLIRHYQKSETDSADTLNRYRRFEFDYPEIGREIGILIEGESLKCAIGLLHIADRLPIAQDYRNGRDKIYEFLVA